MIEPIPEDYEKVEIFVNGTWIAAVFYPADFSPSGDEDDDEELWWMNHFQAADGNEYPEAQSGDSLPPWRRK